MPVGVVVVVMAIVVVVVAVVVVLVLEVLALRFIFCVCGLQYHINTITLYVNCYIFLKDLMYIPVEPTESTDMVITALRIAKTRQVII